MGIILAAGVPSIPGGGATSGETSAGRPTVEDGAVTDVVGGCGCGCDGGSVDDCPTGGDMLLYRTMLPTGAVGERNGPVSEAAVSTGI